MGKVMSVAVRRAVQPLKDFNLEQRAFKEITREKARPAPRHPGTPTSVPTPVPAPASATHAHTTSAGISDVATDKDLLQRLRSVYVTSQDVKPVKEVKAGVERPLPVDRTLVSDPEYGYFEPRKVPYGKVTLRDAVEAISQHQQDPHTWTSEKIALEYKLDMTRTESILQHFRTFVLIIPEDAKDTKINPSTLRTIPWSAPDSLKQLTAPKSGAGLLGVDEGAKT